MASMLSQRLTGAPGSQVSVQSSTWCRACPALAPAKQSMKGRRALQVQAAVKPPQGVSTPAQKPEVPPAAFGFVNWAEKINGRAAMLGFIGISLIEAVANKGILEMVGLQVGKGLGFEL